ncbi:MAG: hypothetical protein HYU52_12875 [Acidobacteria bacterium]|nr:hypothetical protein [Acidobacteriota bacterium]
MRIKIAAFAFASALFALSMHSAEPAKTAEAQDKDKPDYSKPAMMYILYEVVVEESQIKAPEPYLLHVPGFGTVGFVLAAAAGTANSDATPMPTIDAFSLLSTPAAYTPYTFRDRWKLWREEKEITPKK